MVKRRDWNALLAAELGHDVKNVLTIIQTLGSMLLEELPPTGDGVQLIDELLHASERAARLSHRLMQLSRDTLSDGPADIVAAVSTQIPMLCYLAKEGVTVELHADEPPIWTALSEADVQQIVFNLAHNGFDAMPSGGTLAIEIRAADGTVALIVRDSGTGMDEETLRYCFEPFFTTKGMRGTGLGLHAVRDTIERVGGRIKVESTAGHGSAIAIYLPVLEAGAAS